MIVAFGPLLDNEVRVVLYNDLAVKAETLRDFEQALQNDTAVHSWLRLPPIDLSALGATAP